MQVLRESGEVVPGLFSTSPGAMFRLNGKKGSQANPAAPTSSFSVDGNTDFLMKSLNKVEEKAKLSSGNKLLEDKLAKALEEIASLKMLVSQKDQGIEEAKAECKQVVDGIEAHKGELELANKTVSASVNVLESKEEEINAWRKKYNSAVALHTKEKAEMEKSYQSEIEKLKKTLERSENNVDNLVVELSEVKMRESELIKKAKDLTYDVEEHIEQNREHVAALKDLTLKNKRMSSLLSSTVQLKKQAMVKAD